MSQLSNFVAGAFIFDRATNFAKDNGAQETLSLAKIERRTARSWTLSVKSWKHLNEHVRARNDRPPERTKIIENQSTSKRQLVRRTGITRLWVGIKKSAIKVVRHHQSPGSCLATVNSRRIGIARESIGKIIDESSIRAPWKFWPIEKDRGWAKIPNSNSNHFSFNARHICHQNSAPYLLGMSIILLQQPIAVIAWHMIWSLNIQKI